MVPRIFVIGFMGSDRKGLAKAISMQLGYRYRDLNTEIEKKDGRNVRRICMLAGEHGLRNQEYEFLSEYDQQTGIVVACSDGVVFDDDCLDILKRNQVFVADADLTCDELWERAVADTSIPYAFMQDDDEQIKYSKFCKLYASRQHLYEQFIGGENVDQGDGLNK